MYLICDKGHTREALNGEKYPNGEEITPFIGEFSSDGEAIYGDCPVKENGEICYSPLRKNND